MLANYTSEKDLLDEKTVIKRCAIKVSLRGRRTKGREGEVECEREARRERDESAIVGRS